MIVLVLFVFAFSCGQQGDSNGPKEKLTAYCIRECVLETADSELCDTECKCAASSLSDEFSKEEFLNLVQNITETNTDNTDNADAIEKLSNTLEICKDRN